MYLDFTFVTLSTYINKIPVGDPPLLFHQKKLLLEVENNLFDQKVGNYLALWTPRRKPNQLFASPYTFPTPSPPMI
jgi:hypothetical protein